MNYCFVITAHYSDKSGFYLLGVYELESAAVDRVELAKAAQCSMTVRKWRMPVGQINMVDVTGEETP